MSDLKNKKIYLAGHTGMVGSAILRELKTRGYNNIITKDLSELDLRNQSTCLLYTSYAADERSRGRYRGSPYH